MIRWQLTLMAAIALGCATSRSAIPYCASELDLPLATSECAADPDTQRMVEELAAIIEEEAGPLLIRVEFSEAGAAESICAQRSGTSSHWNVRARVAGRMTEIRAIAPGPACLAGSRLDLNQLGAKLAEMEGARDRCRREHPSGPAIPDITSPHHQRTIERGGSCIEAEQAKRGEIWMIDQQGREHVFVRSAGGSERRDAIHGCSRNRVHLALEPSASDPELVHVIIDPDGLTRCLRGYGWEPLF